MSFHIVHLDFVVVAVASSCSALNFLSVNSVHLWVTIYLDRNFPISISAFPCGHCTLPSQLYLSIQQRQDISPMIRVEFGSYLCHTPRTAERERERKMYVYFWSSKRKVKNAWNYLIAFWSVTWIEDDVIARIIQTCFITSNFTSFAEHPVLSFCRCE